MDGVDLKRNEIAPILCVTVSDFVAREDTYQSERSESEIKIEPI